MIIRSNLKILPRKFSIHFFSGQMHFWIGRICFSMQDPHLISRDRWEMLLLPLRGIWECQFCVPLSASLERLRHFFSGVVGSKRCFWEVKPISGVHISSRLLNCIMLKQMVSVIIKYLTFTLKWTCFCILPPFFLYKSSFAFVAMYTSSMMTTQTS